MPLTWETYAGHEYDLECDKCGKDITAGTTFKMIHGVYIVHPACQAEMEKRILQQG